MSAESTALAKAPERGKLVAQMAEKYGLDASLFYTTIVNTIFPTGKDKNGHQLPPPTKEQVAAFLMVANKYGLDPFTKEIYAFPAKSGGIVPVVSIDGWINLINRHPAYDGTEYVENTDAEGKLISITCTIHRKDRQFPMKLTEWMYECWQDKDTWTKWPSRMLRHKVTIQTGRYSFGFSGIYDPDEAERILDAQSADPEQIAPSDMPKRLSAAPEVIEVSEISDTPEPQEPEKVESEAPVDVHAPDAIVAKGVLLSLLNIWKQCVKVGIEESVMREKMMNDYGIEHRNELTNAQATALTAAFSKWFNAEKGKAK